MPKKSEIEDRKFEGIHISLKEDVQAKNATTLLEDVILIHNALPELNFDDIDTSTTFLNHKFSAPLLIDAMTGGTKEAAKINSNLAAAAEELGIGMGVGSQRAGLNSKEMAETYAVARKKAPSAFLIANIGGAQLVEGLDVKKIKKLIDMIKANAIAIHLNPLQELIQPEGEPRFKGVLESISKISSDLGIPVVVKEVGSGISREVAVRLEVTGVSAINVAGLGGTSWAAIEYFRAKKRQMNRKAELGELFWDWGIPTAASIIEVKRTTDLPIIASGGVRTGLDVAKCIVLGAGLAGMAHPLLSVALKSEKEVANLLKKVVQELRSTMFITGVGTIKDLSKARYVITGRLSEWKASL
ncbi:MAG: type 2 isopentenyl-diphosphate Delta-isomerase [Nitrososphaerales archaeon]